MLDDNNNQNKIHLLSQSLCQKQTNKPEHEQGRVDDLQKHCIVLIRLKQIITSFKH